MYQPRPVAEVTTEDLIVTIARDYDDLATFEARHAFRARTGSDWREYAPPNPRTRAQGVSWWDFHETGLL